MKRFALAALLIALFLPAPEAPAATGYVTEALEITLRAGPGLDFRIVTMVKAGERLETISEDNGWTQVKTAGSKSGWIVSRYFTTTPPRAPRLDVAEAERDKALGEAKTAAEAAAGLQKELAEANQTLARTAKELEATQREFTKWKTTHADTIAMNEELQSLRASMSTASDEVGALTMENRQLKARRRVYWGLAGALVVLIGWVLGYLYTTMRSRSKAGTYHF